MIKPINAVRKDKKRLLFVLDSLAELDNFVFSEYIPLSAKNPEVTCKPVRHHAGKYITNGKPGQYVLEIDWIIDIEVGDVQKNKR